MESLSLSHYENISEAVQTSCCLYCLRDPVIVLPQVLHFSEFSQNERKEPDPCRKSKKQEALADSSLEEQKETRESLTLQVSHPELLSLFL